LHCGAFANQRRHGNATIHSLFIAVAVDVTVNNTKVLSVTTEMQQWILVAVVELQNTFVLLKTITSGKY
jgi:hypothetical protein